MEQREVEHLECMLDQKEEIERLRDTILHICEDKCMHEYGPGFCESCPAYEVVKEERGGE